MNSEDISVSTHKPHIILLNTGRVTNAKGGTEKVFCDMANALIKRGYEVTLLFCDTNQGKAGFHIENGIRYVNAYKEKFSQFLYRNPWKNLICYRLNSNKRKMLRAVIDSKWRGDLIGEALKSLPKANLFISFQAEATWILRDYLKIKDPLITMFHGCPSFFFNEPKFYAYSDAVGKSDILQVLMPEFVKEVRNKFPSARVVTIPNVAPQYKEQSNLSIKTIITMARVSPEKRPDLLIHAFSILKDKFPDWKCEWYGEFVDKEYLAKLHKLIRNNGLQERFLLPGETDQVQDHLRQASIFAFPSACEGFSLAMAEAFSMGIPVVGCLDCASTNSIVSDKKNGLLVTPTPESYANGLKFLMSNENIRWEYGAQGKEDMKRYSADVVWDAWDQLIRELT